MIKYYLKTNGQEVKVGDTIKISSQTETPFGVGTTVLHVTMTQDLIPMLLEHEVIEKRESDKDLRVYIKKFAKRFGLSFSGAKEMLSVFIEKEPALAASALLKEISITLNMDKGSLADLPKVYVISSINGKIYEVPKKDIKTYAHFAPFRSREQAKEAYDLLGTLLNDMYE